MTPSVDLWPVAPPDLTIASEEVHVWRAALDLSASRVQTLQRSLAADELRRAERFYFARDRARFIAGRGLLRAILSRYLAVMPDRLCFSYNAYGKPALMRTPDHDDLAFNLSHADGLAVYAVTRDRAVGIDVERMRPAFACEEVAAHFFSPREVSALRALPPEARQEGFFQCWTCKEAYVKARGEGLSLPLKQFDVCLDPAQPAGLVDNRRDPRDVLRWSFVRLAPGREHLVALVVEGHGWQLRCWQWPE